MRDEELQTLVRLEETYWWHVGRRRLVASVIGRFARPPKGARTLDIGCGAGRNLRELDCELGRRTGLDIVPEVLAHARTSLEDVVCGDATRLPFRDASFHLITALDALEHVEDDHVALREIYRLLVPGGRVVLGVPAYRFLWSSHDEALGHRRRYVAAELHQKLNVAGFRVLKRTYCVTILFPIIAAVRIWQGLVPSITPRSSYVMLPGWLNGLFVRFLRLEGTLLRYFSLPFGSSILIVGERPAEQDWRRSRDARRLGAVPPAAQDARRE